MSPSLCHHLFPLPSWNVLSMGPAVTCSLPRALSCWWGEDQESTAAGKSDLYLKNKKSNKPQMFCNKPFVMTCPNTCAVSLLTSVGAVGGGTPGSPSGLAATSPAPVPAGKAPPGRECHAGAGPSPTAGASPGPRVAAPSASCSSCPGAAPPQGDGKRSWRPCEKPFPGWGRPGASLAGSAWAAAEELGAAKTESLPWEVKQTQTRQGRGGG